MDNLLLVIVAAGAYLVYKNKQAQAAETAPASSGADPGTVANVLQNVQDVASAFVPESVAAPNWTWLPMTSAGGKWVYTNAR